MKKRILSVLIVLAMLLGALPFEGFALDPETTITYVLLEMEEYPTAGAGLCYPQMTSANGDTALADEAVSVTFTKWYSAEHYSLDGTTYGGYYEPEFTAGRAYNLNLSLTPAEGYVIAEDCDVVLVVDGDQFFGGYFYEREGDEVTYDFFFNLTGVDAILSDGQMELSNLPQIGERVYDLMPELVSLDGNESYLLPLDYTAFWKYYDEEDSTFYGEDGPFREGYEYTLFIDVYAKEEYTLSPDFDLRLSTPAGEMVGEPIEANGVKMISFAFDFGELGVDEQTIEAISLVASTRPKAGETPFSYSISSINGTADLKENATVQTWWGAYDAEEEVYLPNGTIPFAAGQKYAAELFIYAADGYVFSPDCQITIVDPEGSVAYNLAYADESELDISIFYPAILLENPFTDVEETAYYRDAVLWAVENGITSGTSATTFGPKNTCTRAQVVTFLWNAAGKPEPTIANPFTDVKSTDWYYKAVLWAVENSITSGTSATTFGPKNPCTRAQVVTFLWRAARQPEPQSSENSFSDVSPSAYYYKAVLWAVEEGITSGTGSGKFSPSMTCTRSQVVTFLYRLMK